MFWADWDYSDDEDDDYEDDDDVSKLNYMKGKLYEDRRFVVFPALYNINKKLFYFFWKLIFVRISYLQ